MKAVIFAVSSRGCEAAVKLPDMMTEAGISERPDIQVYIKSKSSTSADSRCVTFFDSDEMAGLVRSSFMQADALIFICAAGIAVRMIAPCLEHKSKDPAVLVIDEGLNYCIPILSGHLGGANELAVRFSDILKCKPVITTASDLSGLTAVDMFAKSLSLAITDYDRAKTLTAALLDGDRIGVINEVPDVVNITRTDLPSGYIMVDAGYTASRGKTENNPNLGNDERSGSSEDTVTGRKNMEYLVRITYRNYTEKSQDSPEGQGFVLNLVPKCLTLGIGCRRGISEDKIREAVNKCLESHNIYKEAVKSISSIDLKSNEEGLLDYCNDEGLPCTFYTAGRLNKVEGDFTGSDFVSEVTGIDNVCERSAVAEGGRLIVRKEIYNGVTIAVSQSQESQVSQWGRFSPGSPCSLYVVGIGPGDEKGMTIRAREVLDKCGIIAGYKTYIDLVKPMLLNDKEYIETGMRAEEERCRMALEAAASGRGDVCMICSGDAGIYGMAGLIYELSGEYPGVRIEVIPGVTAAMSGSALLGAALGHDCAIISLSDLLTPWDLIEKRLKAAAEGDFVIAIYNPSSRKRADYLKKACDIVGKIRGADTVCGYVRNIGRDGEEVVVTSLKELGDAKVDMFTTVFIGNSMTENIDGHMVTPRGYKL